MTQINYAESLAKLKSYGNGATPDRLNCIFWHDDLVNHKNGHQMAYHVCDDPDSFLFKWEKINFEDVHMIGIQLSKEPPPEQIESYIKEWITKPFPKYFYIVNQPGGNNIWYVVKEWIIDNILKPSFMTYIEIRSKDFSDSGFKNYNHFTEEDKEEIKYYNDKKNNLRLVNYNFKKVSLWE
tara:strand:- start:1042 stop:1584 length:543 start_codon:yes stop_codon:yes gene_type:complete